MSKTISIFIIATIFAMTGALAQHHEHEPAAQTLYTCPMHSEIVRKEPGECPKCGMTLVLLKQKEKRRTPRPQALRDSVAGGPNIEHRTSNAEHLEHQTSNLEHSMPMQSSINIADPMNREGSGTSWLPDSSPMFGYMYMFGDDMLMLHGSAFPRYTNVSSRRGDDRIDAPNMFMAMYSHPLGANTQLGAHLMMSLDPLTEQGRGYPLLFQSGESWHDMALHDRQHPHDLFDEVSVSLSQKLPVDLSAYLYFGYPGEPALGPPTFMHRPSAMDNPDAPIGHHWEDSTHITFGVATAGVQWRNLKVEGSIFTGRESDEDRYDFDRPRFDSYSGRISWNPTPNLALQVSHGYIRSPEALEPEVNRHRTTASAIYNLRLGRDINWSNTFVWGRNNDSGEKTNAFLLETNFQRGRDTVYGRWERVEKSAHELVLRERDHGRIFLVNAATIGYVRDVSPTPKIDIGIGGQFTLNFWPDGLDRYYGNDGVGYGFQVFVRLRPPLHSHGAHDDHEHVTQTEK